jgi:hypothetical protein
VGYSACPEGTLGTRRVQSCSRWPFRSEKRADQAESAKARELVRDRRMAARAVSFHGPHGLVSILRAAVASISTVVPISGTGITINQLSLPLLRVFSTVVPISGTGITINQLSLPLLRVSVPLFRLVIPV